jgi:hypothetical protein
VTGRAGVLLTVVVAIQLLLSLRFFFKYVDPLPGAAYAAYLVAGLLAWSVVLRSPRLLGLLGRRRVLGLGLVALLVLVSVAYPRADALRAVGRGSDQDDCVRAMVGNVLALRAPYGVGYFGDPCSTGPGELVPYLPLALWDGYLVVVPVLAVLLGYRVLTLLTDRATAVLLSLTQLVCWLFLEMAATGSDLVVIGWLFALATTASTLGLRRHDPVLTCVGGTAYLLFATSRVPLLVVTAASGVVLLAVCGARAWRVVAPVLLGATALYVGTWAVAPARFRPGHLVGKSVRILRDLGDDRLAWLLLVGVLALFASAVVVLRHGLVGVLRLHHGWAHLLAVTAPMAAVALWDLERKGFDPAAWEGLHYLYLGVPALLVVAAQHRGPVRSAEVRSVSECEPGRRGTVPGRPPLGGGTGGRKGRAWRAPLPRGPSPDPPRRPPAAG